MIKLRKTPPPYIQDEAIYVQSGWALSRHESGRPVVVTKFLPAGEDFKIDLSIFADELEVVDNLCGAVVVPQVRLVSRIEGKYLSDKRHGIWKQSMLSFDPGQTVVLRADRPGPVRFFPYYSTRPPLVRKLNAAGDITFGYEGVDDDKPFDLEEEANALLRSLQP